MNGTVQGAPVPSYSSRKPSVRLLGGATSTGLWHSVFLALMSAPKSSSSFTTAVQSFSAAACKGESKNLPFCTLAPASRTATNPKSNIDAQIRSVSVTLSKSPGWLIWTWHFRSSMAIGHDISVQWDIFAAPCLNYTLLMWARQTIIYWCCFTGS